MCFFSPIGGACEDDDINCASWAEHGFCEDNPGTALVICKKSCNACSAGEQSKLLSVFSCLTRYKSDIIITDGTAFPAGT